MRREFGGEPARHPDQPHLRRRQVRASAAARRDRAVAAEEQDAAVLVLDHLPDQRARQVERAVEDDAADQLPIRVGGFEKRLVRPDRGIVDEDVDPAELGQRLARQGFDLGLVADIGENRDGLDPEIAGLARDGLGLLLVGAGVDDDMRALPGQLQHRRTADIAARSGDQRDLPFELAHDSPLPHHSALSAIANMPHLRILGHLRLLEDEGIE